MAIDKWRWPLWIQDNQAMEVTDRVRSVKFGDGYENITPEGINWQQTVFPLAFIGGVDEAKEVFNFLNTHKVTPFTITPTGGVLGLYRVKKDSVKMTPYKSTQVMAVTATLEQSFGFYGGDIG